MIACCYEVGSLSGVPPCVCPLKQYKQWRKDSLLRQGLICPMKVNEAPAEFPAGVRPSEFLWAEDQLETSTLLSKPVSVDKAPLSRLWIPRQNWVKTEIYSTSSTTNCPVKSRYRELDLVKINGRIWITWHLSSRDRKCSWVNCGEFFPAKQVWNHHH